MSRSLALVTGATSGIGAAWAEKLAFLGYDLVLTGRRKEKLMAVAERISAVHRVEASVRIVELTDQATLEALAAEVATLPVGFLVNNAGFSIQGSFAEQDPGSQIAMVGTHVVGPLRLVQAVLPGMLAKGKGTIVNVSSVSAFLPRAGSVMYSSTKAWLLAWSRALHAELGPRGIRVLALCPGFTRTDFHKRMGLEASILKDRGLVRWMSAEQVVELGWKSLERGRVLCVPGGSNHLLALLSPLLRRIFEAKASTAYRKTRGEKGRIA
jgi:short-subunit dehydrogenase